MSSQLALQIATVTVLLIAGAAAQDSNLAEIVIPGQPPLVLELPALDPVSTGDVLDRLLSAVDVPFGLEIVPPIEPRPRVDFAQRPEKKLALNGRSLKKQPQAGGKSVVVMFMVTSSDGWQVGRNFHVARW